MNLPLVVSASKLHTMQVKNIRQHYMQEAYLNKPRLIASSENPNMSKANLHNHKNSKPAKKKGKSKRKSNRVKTDCEANLGLNNSVAKGKNRRNQAEKNSLNTTKDLNNSPSVVLCSVKKIISSYSTKRFTRKPKSTRTNPTTSPRRPQTGSSKNLCGRKTAEVEIKRQSCPPPPLHTSQSPIRKEVRIKKVYYSEAQSQMLAGVPRVPPATPLNDVFIAVEVVPCMADIKSQQAIKTKLRNLEIQRQKANEKLRDKFLKEEKRREKEQRENMKQQRRAEIYALNKVMTDHERSKFLQFMKEKNNGSTSISLKV